MQNRPLTMVRPDLDGLPRFPLPPTFSIRWYRSGDEAHWQTIHEDAEKLIRVTPTLFREQFGHDENALGNRQAYLCTGTGCPIGTATAWADSDYDGRHWGRVHWVAIRPAWQRRGLSKPLLAAVCDRLAFLGETRAYLRTSTARLAAIALYLKFGFAPDLPTEEDRNSWRVVERALHR